MYNFATYIITVFILFSISFASGKSKSSSLNQNDFNVDLGEIIIEETASEDVVYRKRAHKRKRKIRPKRNGF